MSSNLRSKPITGHVTDGSGNVIRNSKIVIKSFTPNGSITVDSCSTNDDGLFTSVPLPNGDYAIYESGVMVSSTMHSPDEISIPVFTAKKSNVGGSTPTFESSLKGDINNYKAYIQIEGENINVSRYGNTYPVSLKEYLTTNDKMASFHQFTSDTKITTTRFDIEFYSPITDGSRSYKRVRWCGVPAIKYGTYTKLVVPLDYYSIVPNNPRYEEKLVDVQINGQIVEVRLDNTRTVPGDIIKVVQPNVTWYGVSVYEKGGYIGLSEWKSSRVSNVTPIANVQATVSVFDGMFQGISSMNSTINEYITVTENTSAQSSIDELYTYERV